MGLPEQKRRLIELDVLRCLAIVLVVLNHSWHLDIPGDRYEYFGWWMVFARGGWIGVPIFFVLSGFLIGNMLLREYAKRKEIRVKRFLVRRGFKIYPAFYSCIVLYSAYLWYSDGAVDYERLLRELFFLQNYGKGGLIDVSWSLAVEEHFYLLFPMVLLGLIYLRGKQFKQVAAIFKPLFHLTLLLVIVCLWLRVRAYHHGGDTDLFLMLGTHLRIDALFIGACLALWYVGWSRSFEKVFKKLGWPALLVCLIVFLSSAIKPVGGLDYFFKTYYLVLLSIASAVLLGVLLTKRMPDRSFVRLAAYIGCHSYSIYLFHLPFIRLINKGLPHLSFTPPAYVLIGFSLVGSCLIGIVASYLIEWPMLKLRDRWFPATIGGYFTESKASKQAGS